MNRREFIGSAAAASLAFSIVPRHVIGGHGFVPPSDKVNLAYIGCGTQGLREMCDIIANPELQIVSVCDPNKLSTNYVDWSPNGIRDGIREVLESDDLVEWWEVWRRLTTRHAFRGPNGADVANELLTVLGGEQVVHGHSVIADQLGIAPVMVDGPYEYAGGKALGVDGGVFVGGPCLVVPLPWRQA